MPGDFGTVGSDDEYYLKLFSSNSEFSVYDKSYLWKNTLQFLGTFFSLKWSAYILRMSMFLCFVLVLWHHLNPPLFFIIYFFSTFLFKDGWFALGLIFLVRWFRTGTIRSLLIALILLIITRPYFVILYLLLPKVYPKKLNQGVWSLIIVYIVLFIFRDNYLAMLPFNGGQFLEYFGERSLGLPGVDWLIVPIRSIFSLNPVTQLKNLVLETPLYNWYSLPFNLAVFCASFYFLKVSLSFFAYKDVDLVLVPILMIYVLPYMLFYNGLVGLRLSLVMYLLLLLRSQINFNEKCTKHIWVKES